MLRKSPCRTPALLAANRRNALKSTGPRTDEGKARSAWNAFLHGGRSTVTASCLPWGRGEQAAFARLVDDLRLATIPAENQLGESMLIRHAAGIWKLKRLYERWVAGCSPRERAELALGLKRMPPFERRVLQRPGLTVPDWHVTISIFLSWGRAPGAMLMRRKTAGRDLGLDLLLGEDAPWLRWDPRPHARVYVHTSVRPWIEAWKQEQRERSDGPEASEDPRADIPERTEQTKPEYSTKQEAWRIDLEFKPAPNPRAQEPRPGAQAPGSAPGKLAASASPSPTPPGRRSRTRRPRTRLKAHPMFRDLVDDIFL